MRADIRECLERHHLKFCTVVVKHIPVECALLKKVLAELHGVLEVAIVAAAYGAIDNAGVLLAQVGIFPRAYAQHGIHRSHVEPAPDVVKAAEGLHQTAISVDRHDLAGCFPGRDIFYKHFSLGCIYESFVSTMVYLSIKQRRVYLRIPDEQRVDYGVYLLPALQSCLIAVDALEFEPEQVAFAGDQTDEQVPFGCGITVEGNDDTFLFSLFCKACDELFCDGRCPAGNYRFNCILFQFRPVHGFRVVKGERVVHKTHIL